MKTKLLVLLCWMFYYAVIQTADAVWLFFFDLQRSPGHLFLFPQP
jgi:hypothetical protein